MRVGGWSESAAIMILASGLELNTSGHDDGAAGRMVQRCDSWKGIRKWR